MGDSSKGRRIRAFWLGRRPYRPLLALQEALLAARAAGELQEDHLLLLEHEPVITLGRSAKAAHLRASSEWLAARGVETVEIGRGGDVTLHAPGQLVAYPIFDLKPERCDVRRYVRDLEEIMIRLVGDQGLSATRIEGLNGAWIGEEKVGAVGVRISRWVTMHGFALNVANDLRLFDWIVPCGIADRGVTSLQRQLGSALSPRDLLGATLAHFAEVFAAEVTFDEALPDYFLASLSSAG